MNGVEFSENYFPGVKQSSGVGWGQHSGTTALGFLSSLAPLHSMKARSAEQTAWADSGQATARPTLLGLFSLPSSLSAFVPPMIQDSVQVKPQESHLL